MTGVLGGFLRRGEYLFNGLAQILNTIPLLAVLPLMIVWFGIDELTKVLLIAFGAGVPMYLNLFAAIRGVDHRLIEMARTTGAGRWRVVSWVLLPGALPGFLVGLRFSLAYSVLGPGRRRDGQRRSGTRLPRHAGTDLSADQPGLRWPGDLLDPRAAGRPDRPDPRAGAAAVAAQLRGGMTVPTPTPDRHRPAPADRRARRTGRPHVRLIAPFSTISISTIDDEELVVLLGPSGCGKSTLLRLLAGLDRPDGGRIEVPAKRAIVFQGDRLLPWQRVLRNVTLGLRGPDADQRARKALADVAPRRTAKGPGPNSFPAVRRSASRWRAPWWPNRS